MLSNFKYAAICKWRLTLATYQIISDMNEKVNKEIQNKQVKTGQKSKLEISKGLVQTSINLSKDLSVLLYR